MKKRVKIRLFYLEGTFKPVFVTAECKIFEQSRIMIVGRDSDLDEKRRFWKIDLRKLKGRYFMWQNRQNSRIIKITDDGTIKIPEDVLLEANLHDEVELISCREGILIKSKKSKSWQEIFQNKAKMGDVLYMDLSEVRLDDIL